MTTSSGGKPKEIDLGEDVGEVVVTANGARVEIHADGGVQVSPKTVVTSPSAVSDRSGAPDEPQIGQVVPGRGVFLGVWSPKDRSGSSLNKTFNLFAAPYDLGLDEQGRGQKLVATYNDAIAAVRTVTHLMGHDGFDGKNDAALYNALRDGSYKGEWFIPTRDIVDGKDKDGDVVQKDNLYRHRNAGMFAKTFTTASGSDSARWYWSCTEHPGYSSYVYSVNVTVGGGLWDGKDNSELFVRPVRAEPRPPA